MSETEIFGIASFYAQFRFNPCGKHAVKVCLGTACHVRGGEEIMKAAENELRIERGDTTDDLTFSLERVACFGSCALSPVMVIDKDVYGRLTTTKVREILSKYNSD
jgi:NADH:ubiquinone oxidoreductase subunit E